MNVTPQLRTFYRYHVYFTTRRILYAMGGISSKSALPDDPTFNNKDNPYDIVSYKKVCAEFGVSPSSDFRYTHGKNHGLGNVFYYDYPGEPDLALFSDERSEDDDCANELSGYETFKAQTASLSILYQTMHKGCPNPGYYA